jgi:hypothetical protein
MFNLFYPVKKIVIFENIEVAPHRHPRFQNSNHVPDTTT